MSYVTNYILTWAGLPSAKLLDGINAELTALDERTQLFVRVDQHAGGNKRLEMRVALLAANYLSVDNVTTALESAIVKHFGGQFDFFRESIRLFVCDEHEDYFTVRWPLRTVQMDAGIEVLCDEFGNVRVDESGEALRADEHRGEHGFTTTVVDKPQRPTSGGRKNDAS